MLTAAMSSRQPDQPGTKSISLSAGDLDSAKRLLRLLVAASEAEPVVERSTKTEVRSAEQLAELARQILSNRKKREKIFGPDMFGELGWESLLMLYANERETRLTIGGLAALSGASKSSLLRWLAFLEENDLVMRTSHPTDRRASFVGLTAAGRQKIEQYLFETLLPSP